MDFSLAEMLVVGVVALVCIGPKELPGTMRTVGKVVGKLRRQANQFWQEIQQDMPDASTVSAPKRTWIQGDDGQLYEAYSVEEHSSTEGKPHETHLAS